MLFSTCSVISKGKQHEEDNKIVFTIANTYSGEIDLSLITKNGYTTKGKGHGLGLYDIDKTRIVQSQHAVGSMISSISGENVLTMFNKDTKDDVLQKLMDNINAKYQSSLVMPAIFFENNDKSYMALDTIEFRNACMPIKYNRRVN